MVLKGAAHSRMFYNKHSLTNLDAGSLLMECSCIRVRGHADICHRFVKIHLAWNGAPDQEYCISSDGVLPARTTTTKALEWQQAGREDEQPQVELSTAFNQSPPFGADTCSATRHHGMGATCCDFFKVTRLSYVDRKPAQCKRIEHELQAFSGAE
eukprot:6477878-Amphidinium_carterae.1